MTQYLLKVTIHKAENLIKSDTLTASSDPYVELKVRKTKFKTKVKQKNLNPVWEETFQFGVKDPGLEYLALNVFDEDKFSRDDKIGACKIPLSFLPFGRPVKMNVKLEHVPHGHLFVTVYPVNFGIQKEKKVQVVKASPSLRVTVHKAIIIKKIKIDPYVVLAIGDKVKKSLFSKKSKLEIDQRVIKKTTVIKDTLAPKWDESFIFPVKFTNDSLEVVVQDKDTFTKDDFIGKAYIPINCLPFDLAVVREVTFYRSNKPMGNILLTLRAIDCGNKELNATQSSFQ